MPAPGQRFPVAYQRGYQVQHPSLREGRESFAELGETVDDLMAEVRSEIGTTVQEGVAVTVGTQVPTRKNKPRHLHGVGCQPKFGRYSCSPTRRSQQGATKSTWTTPLGGESG